MDSHDSAQGGLRPAGVAALFLSATLFAFVTLAVKLASRSLSGYFVSGSRFLIGLTLCVAVIAWRRTGFRLKFPRMVILRGLFGAASMVSSYIAITLTGPGRATLLGNTYPVFVALFGALLFKEALSGRTMLSLAVCTGGAVLVMRDGSGAALSGDLLALGSAVFAGLAVNCVRRASSRGESPFILYLSPCIFGLPILAVAPMPSAPVGPWPLALLLFVGCGAFVAQALMSVGYRSVPAGRGSVVFYWETALTVLLGFLFGGEKPTLRFGIGVVVILGGLWLNGAAGKRKAAEGLA
jgi:drug/metabolite transporter (DMT)-like permease